MKIYLLVLLMLFLGALFEHSTFIPLGIQRGKYNKNRKLLYWILVLILILISGLRYDTGTDSITYYKYFEQMIAGVEVSYSKSDLGFYYLQKVIAILSDKPQSIILVTSSIIIFLIAKEIFNDAYMPFIGLFCFAGLYYYFLSFNILRQFIAVSIVFSANRFLFKGETMKYVAAILLAALFHFSALIMLVTFPLIKKKQTQLIKTLCVAIIGIAFFLPEPISKLLALLIPRYTVYIKYGRGASADSKIFILLLFLVVIWLLEKRYAKKIKNYYFYENCALYALTICILANVNILFLRVALYYEINLILFLANAYPNIHPKNRKIVKMCGLFVISIYCIWNLRINNGNIVPYTSCFAK